MVYNSRSALRRKTHSTFIVVLIGVLFSFSSANAEHAGITLPMIEKEFAVCNVDLGFRNSKMSSAKVVDPLSPPKNVRIGVIKGDTITFKALLTPEIMMENKDYNWAGAKTGTGSEISVTFNDTGNKNETLTTIGFTRSATTTVIYVPPPNETTWALTHPLEAFVANSLGNEAIQWARDNAGMLGGEVHNGRADAARHAYWNVLMTIEIGATDADGASTAHERTNLEKNEKHNEIVMDMENNTDGRAIGGGLPPDSSRDACQNAVINALNAGTLTILDDLSNPSGGGLLQPSNE